MPTTTPAYRGGSGRLAVLLLACVTLNVAQAGNIAVKPVRLRLEPGQFATSVVVSNTGNEPKQVQVSAFRWTRQEGQDRYSTDESGDDLIVTPPLFQLAAGASQVVRIGFERAIAAAPNERAWRVIVEEVQAPPARHQGGDAQPSTAIAMRMRFILPMLLPPRAPRQDLNWEGSADVSGAVRLTAINAGNVSERIDELVLLRAGQHQVLGRLSGPLYVFPGERRDLAVQTISVITPGPVELQLQGTPQPPVSDFVLRAQ